MSWWLGVFRGPSLGCRWFKNAPMGFQGRSSDVSWSFMKVPGFNIGFWGVPMGVTGIFRMPHGVPGALLRVSGTN